MLELVERTAGSTNLGRRIPFLQSLLHIRLSHAGGFSMVYSEVSLCALALGSDGGASAEGRCRLDGIGLDGESSRLGVVACRGGV